MAHFDVDTKDLKRYQRDLLKMSREALPYATKQTVNDVAFQARREWQHEITSSFTLRNKFTANSIRVVPTRAKTISQQEAIVGSIAPYMGTQEKGGVIRGKGQGKAIPTKSARVGSSPSRLVRRPNKVSKIKLHNRTGGSERQRNAAQIRKAATSGNKFAYIEKGAKRGIFQVKGRSKGIKLTLIHNLSKPRVTIKPEPTMEPAMKRASKFVPRAYHTALTFQLHRLKTYRR